MNNKHFPKKATEIGRLVQWSRGNRRTVRKWMGSVTEAEISIDEGGKPVSIKTSFFLLYPFHTHIMNTLQCSTYSMKISWKQMLPFYIHLVSAAALVLVSAWTLYLMLSRLTIYCLSLKNFPKSWGACNDNVIENQFLS